MSSASPGPRLDDWLPDPHIRTYHSRVVAADPEAVWSAARDLRLSDTRSLGRLVRWRMPDTPAEISFRELLDRYPFILLEETPTWSLSGLCGRIWTLRKDYARLGAAEDFRAWVQPGTARVLIANWVAPAGDGQVRLCNEARVQAVDRGAALRLRVLWAAIGRFEPLIGSEAVTTAVRRSRSEC